MRAGSEVDGDIDRRKSFRTQRLRSHIFRTRKNFHMMFTLSSDFSHQRPRLAPTQYQEIHIVEPLLPNHRYPKWSDAFKKVC